MSTSNIERGISWFLFWGNVFGSVLNFYCWARFGAVSCLVIAVLNGAIAGWIGVGLKKNRSE